MIEDSKIREALHHWTPRFLANGVDYNDLQRIIASMEKWDDWCRVWSELGAEHEALAEAALAAGGTVSAAKAFVRAAIYYHFGQMIFYALTDHAFRIYALSRKGFKAAGILDDSNVPMAGTRKKTNEITRQFFVHETDERLSFARSNVSGSRIR